MRVWLFGLWSGRFPGYVITWKENRSRPNPRLNVLPFVIVCHLVENCVKSVARGCRVPNPPFRMETIAAWVAACTQSHAHLPTLNLDEKYLQ